MSSNFFRKYADLIVEAEAAPAPAQQPAPAQPAPAQPAPAPQAPAQPPAQPAPAQQPAPKIDDAWFQQGSFTAAKKATAREPFRVLDQPEVIKSLEGDLQGKAGDYVITGPNGEEYLNDPATFNNIKTDNGDGTASPKAIPKQVKLADHDGTLHTSWGDLEYTKGNDYIVRHGTGDYGAVKKDIFPKTYDTLDQEAAPAQAPAQPPAATNEWFRKYADMVNEAEENLADKTDKELEEIAWKRCGGSAREFSNELMYMKAQRDKAKKDAFKHGASTNVDSAGKVGQEYPTGPWNR